MDWLYEGRFAVYGCLVFTWVGCLLIWSIGKFHHIVPITLILVSFIASYLLLDSCVVTNKEKAEFLLGEISNLCKSGRIQEITKHLDPRFSTRKGTNKAELVAWIKKNQVQDILKELIFWDFEDMKIHEAHDTFKISCMVKVKGNLGTYQEGIYRIEFLLQTNRDKNLTIISFQLFDPISANNQVEIGI